MTNASTPCLIVGAGAAGVSAAQWFISLDVPFEWVSQDGEVGGMLHEVYNPITNYTGQV